MFFLGKRRKAQSAAKPVAPVSKPKYLPPLARGTVVLEEVVGKGREAISVVIVVADSPTAYAVLARRHSNGVIYQARVHLDLELAYVSAQLLMAVLRRLGPSELSQRLMLDCAITHPDPDPTNSKAAALRARMAARLGREGYNQIRSLGLMGKLRTRHIHDGLWRKANGLR